MRLEGNIKPANNIDLYYEFHRNGELPPVALLHGFMGSARDWDPITARLKNHFSIITIDLPGHGLTPGKKDDGFYTFSSTAKQIIRIMDILAIEKCPLIGYSLGGRLALYMAVHFPERFTHHVLESAGPGIKDHAERAERVRADSVLMEQIVRDYPSFLEQWYLNPIFGNLPSHPDYARLLASRIDNTPAELVKSLRNSGQGVQEPIWDQLADIRVPLLLLSGEQDVKYHDIHNQMQARNAAFIIRNIQNSGHNIHFQNPDAFVEKIIEFLTIRENMNMSSVNWSSVGSFTDIIYEKGEGIAKITINRPEVRNAFRPLTVMEMSTALTDAREDAEIGVIILTGQGDKAFCSGGDQKIRGDSGYKDEQGVHRLNVLDFQRQIRTCPKPVVAMVAGYAIGGGHVLHLLCDLTIAADNAVFGQTGPKVGSFDGGYGASYMARIVGQKKAREIWFLCRQYNAQQALDMGLVNTVVPLEKLEEETIQWCREMLANSPTAIRCLKAALNADCDGQSGLQELAGCATMLYYMSDEAQEGKNAFLEKRKPDFGKFPRQP